MKKYRLNRHIPGFQRDNRQQRQAEGINGSFNPITRFAFTHHLNLPFFKRKPKITLRPGAMEPEEALRILEKAQLNDTVYVTRVDLSGEVDQTFEGSLVVISEDHYSFTIRFSGESNNREAIDEDSPYINLPEMADTVEFDIRVGDISSIELIKAGLEELDDIEEIIPTDQVIEMINALDESDIISIMYDDYYEGVKNFTGELLYVGEGGAHFKLGKIITDNGKEKVLIKDFNVHEVKITFIQLM